MRFCANTTQHNATMSGKAAAAAVAAAAGGSEVQSRPHELTLLQHIRARAPLAELKAHVDRENLASRPADVRERIFLTAAMNAPNDEAQAEAHRVYFMNACALSELTCATAEAVRECLLLDDHVPAKQLCVALSDCGLPFRGPFYEAEDCGWLTMKLARRGNVSLDTALTLWELFQPPCLW